MKQLIKYKLDFEPTWAHVQDNLEETNLLSLEMLRLDLKKGCFFTLIPIDANLSQLYKFKEGGILVQNPIEEQIINGHRSFYSWIPDIELELSHMMLQEILSNDALSYMFDDYVCDLKRVDGYGLFNKYGFHFKEEIYYVLNNKNISIELIKECLKNSNALWHSLCVFTTADFSHMKKELTVDNVKEICQQIELFMVWAYDSEGYVFWEKEDCKYFEQNSDTVS